MKLLCDQENNAEELDVQVLERKVQLKDLNSEIEVE